MQYLAKELGKVQGLIGELRGNEEFKGSINKILEELIDFAKKAGNFIASSGEDFDYNDIGNLPSNIIRCLKNIKNACRKLDDKYKNSRGYEILTVRHVYLVVEEIRFIVKDLLNEQFKGVESEKIYRLADEADEVYNSIDFNATDPGLYEKLQQLKPKSLILSTRYENFVRFLNHKEKVEELEDRVNAVKGYVDKIENDLKSGSEKMYQEIKEQVDPLMQRLMNELTMRLYDEAQAAYEGLLAYPLYNDLLKYKKVLREWIIKIKRGLGCADGDIKKKLRGGGTTGNKYDKWMLRPASDFKNCRKIEIPESVEEINKGLFKDNQKLETITFPNSVKYIQSEAFSGCTNLKATRLLALSDNIIRIGDRAFFGCNSLKETGVPSKIQEMGDGIFEGCQGLQKIRLGCHRVGITSRMCAGCSNLETVTFNDGIKVIGEKAFMGCVNLGNITLPSGLNNIEAGAFADTHFQTLKIPNMRQLGKLPTIDVNAFSGSTIKQLIVPDHLEEHYKGVFLGQPNCSVEKINDTTINN